MYKSLTIVALIGLFFAGQVSADSHTDPDFNDDGIVDLLDYSLFVKQWNTREGDQNWDAKFDLNSDGVIDLLDYGLFTDNWNKTFPVPPSGGGGGGSSSPDLIVESPSVSDNTLMTGQSFTLSATVRNQGTGSSASTTLRYYRSSDATISTSDTEVGTDAVGSLNASGTSAESISLNAPSSAGTYYYGACVESVSGEINTDNNCSSHVTIRVNTQARGTGISKLYWTDPSTDKIYRANLNGSNVEDLVTIGLESPRSLVLDITGGKMYWTDTGTDKIQRANLDGSNVEDLITGLESLKDLVLDVTGGKMYWMEGWRGRGGKIQRANLDGSNVEDLITGSGAYSNLVLDVTGGKMYWTDNRTDKIQRANLDGSNVEDLITKLDDPRSLVLDLTGGKMYWTNIDKYTYWVDSSWGIVIISRQETGYRGGIERADLDGSNRETVLNYTSTMRPDLLALDVSPQ